MILFSHIHLPATIMMSSSKNLLFFLLCFCLTACQSETKVETKVLHSPYFGLAPTETPQILAPEIISTSLTEYNGTFSPDGREFFYTSEAGGKGHIVYTRLDSLDNWTTPQIASFSGTHSEYDPLFSPDGTSLYFSSERPVNDSSPEGPTHIWRVEKTAAGWGEPIHIPLTGQGDFFSSITTAGDIYFNTWNTGEILKATATDSGYHVSALPEIINSRIDAGDAFISPNEEYLIYRSYYNDGYGRGDLYISFKVNGEWTAPENLGEPINSQSHEMCPFVTTDGKMFIFASDRMADYYASKDLEGLKQKFHSHDNGQLNIYYMSADFIDNMKAKHLTGE